MFNQEKVLQEIIYLLSLNDNKLNLLKLMKELYIADRNSIKNRGYSISRDEFLSMKHGPVLKNTYSNIQKLFKTNGWDKYLKQEKQENKNYYQEKKNYYNDIILLDNGIELDLLSINEKNILKEVSDEWKNSNEWDIRNYTHTELPEYKETNKRIPIEFKDILEAVGYNKKEILEIIEEQDSFSKLQKFLIGK